MHSSKNVIPILKNTRNFRNLQKKTKFQKLEKQQVLQLVKNVVHEVDNNAEIILYGSRARGDYHEESDWDFLVLLDDGDNFDVWEKLREKLYYMELESGEIFSIISHSKEYWDKLKLSYFHEEVTKEGIKI